MQGIKGKNHPKHEVGFFSSDSNNNQPMKRTEIMFHFRYENLYSHVFPAD